MVSIKAEVVMGAAAVLLTLGSGCSTSEPETPPNPRPSAPVSSCLVVAVGARGTILTGTDDGLHWRQTRFPTSEVLCAVDFSDDGTSGWAVGSGGLILRTADGGQTWIRQRVTDLGSNVSLTGVSAVSAREAWVAGEEVLHTADGGAHWERVSTAPGGRAEVMSDSREQIAFADAESGWAAGRQVVATMDGGASWTVAWRFDPSGLALNPLHVVCADADHVWVGGSIGTGRSSAILASDDGGATWRRQLRFSGGVQDLWCSDAKRIWVLGGSRIYRSVDGGRRWRWSDVPSNNGLGAIAFGGGQVGWLATQDRDAIYSSQDGGATWTRDSALDAYPMDLWARPD